MRNQASSSHHMRTAPDPGASANIKAKKLKNATGTKANTNREVIASK